MSSPAADAVGFPLDEQGARALDAADPLAEHREAFALPRDDAGAPVIYFAGNSLGLMPHAARATVDEELDDWARRGVEGHFEAARPWYDYHRELAAPGARLVGAQPDEIVMMNSLTVNLHLMLVSFFRPDGARRKILVDWPIFPSDLYVVKTHLASRGLDPGRDLIIVRPRDDEHVLRTEDVERRLEAEGDTIALVMLAGVNYFTGQCIDMATLAASARARGCTVGLDLAHAAGNVELRLHDWNVDFACWCSYKYLNAGPGAIAGCFVHERHARDRTVPRYGGWWGNDPDTRFRMHLEPEFVPRADADGWQLSNPPILSMAPLRASLALFDDASMPALAAKSSQLTGYLRFLLERQPAGWFEIITPRAPGAHGCQLSFRVRDRPTERLAALKTAGVVCDFRPPDVLRAAPVPLYNTFHEVWRFARILTESGRS